MKIVVISGSPRKQGNTEIMVQEFARGAEESGHEVVIKRMSELKVAPCLGCQYCFGHDGVCVQQDDMTGILTDVDEADMVVFASPIYWFDISAQLKTVIDRLYARGAKGFHHRKVALLLDSASDGVYSAAIAQYQATNTYLRWEDQGIITISGMEEKGSMKESARLKEVYEFGKSVH